MTAIAAPTHAADPVPAPGRHWCEVCRGEIDLVEGMATVCPNCGHRDTRLSRRSARLCLVFSLTALIFYVPANLFPFMTIELYGNRSSSTIWGGTVALAQAGSWGIAIIVFLASILIPLLKLLILFYLSLSAATGERPRFKTQLYRFVEAIGRWSMLDIFLLAVLVAIVKLSHWTKVQPEKGAAMFALVVVFTMMASAYFDPRVLWDKKIGQAK